MAEEKLNGETAVQTTDLERGLTFMPALASNMLNMVGVGPFLTIPLILTSMRGPQAFLGWLCGALISVCDGLVWAEFGASIPDSGGSYAYLREAFAPWRIGELMGFLFLWQVLLAGPLTAASGGVGFADYARYLFPGMTGVQHTLLAMTVCALASWLLYRDIKTIGQISVVLWIGLLLAIGVILVSGFSHFNAARAFDFPPGAFHLSREFIYGLGAATLIATYDFSGYFNICLIGGEVKRPGVTIPRVIWLSIAILAVLYFGISISVVTVLPWREAMHSQAIMSDFIARLYGSTAAKWMTALILWIAFASIFCVLLGYTRVPFAAAKNRQFFRSFARVHPRKHFPSFSVAAMGVTSVAACLFSLEALIRMLIILQIITQFAAQCIGLLLLRRTRPDIARPFRMFLYPLPVIVALGGWIFVLGSNSLMYLLAAVVVALLGVAAYWWHGRFERLHGTPAHE